MTNKIYIIIIIVIIQTSHLPEDPPTQVGMTVDVLTEVPDIDEVVVMKTDDVVLVGSVDIVVVIDVTSV